MYTRLFGTRLIGTRPTETRLIGTLKIDRVQLERVSLARNLLFVPLLVHWNTHPFYKVVPPNSDPVYMTAKFTTETTRISVSLGLST